MIVTIIGSLSCEDRMYEAEKHFKSLGCEVYCPLDKDLQSRPLLEIQMIWIYNIERSDLVVVIPKKYGMENDAKSKYTFEVGESTSYEMAICRHFNKRFVIWG